MKSATKKSMEKDYYGRTSEVPVIIYAVTNRQSTMAVSRYVTSNPLCNLIEPLLSFVLELQL